LRLKRKAGPDVWVFRWYDETNGARTYRKRTLGTVLRYPHLRDAEKAADALRNTINSEFKVPETVSELVTHYRENELTEEKKAYATIEANTHYLTNHIEPKWGAMYLQCHTSWLFVTIKGASNLALFPNGITASLVFIGRARGG
jgi:hypothetical protein